MQSVPYNNPGNIRNVNQQWIGQTGQQNGFCVFQTMELGYRALFINLNSYINSGFTTIQSIINKWTPVSENRPGIPQIYAKALGIDVNFDIRKMDFWEFAVPFAKEMTFIENSIIQDIEEIWTVADNIEDLEVNEIIGGDPQERNGIYYSIFTVIVFAILYRVFFHKSSRIFRLFKYKFL